MEGLIGLVHGLGVALALENIPYAVIGCMVGMLVGVLPGIGQSTGMVLLIPITFHLSPTGAIIMLSCIYYGAAYGGTLTSVLMNVPGESETVVTTFDGHPMARQGRGGIALGIAAIGSFIGGVSATIALALLAVPLGRLALRLGPSEYFSLMLLGLTLAVSLLGRSAIKGIIMVLFGLLLTQVGMDSQLGMARLTFGQVGLMDGIPLLAIIIGFFGLSDVLLSVFRSSESATTLAPVSRILPQRSDLKESAGPIARGSIVGFALGILPGMANSVSTFCSYILEKRLSRTPERFGQGAIAGVAGPETANNAFANAAFLPLLTLGIPTSAALSILFGAFRIHGIAPGPLLFREHPDVAWGLISSMIVGNAILLVFSLPMLRLWLLVLRIPPAVLGAAIVTFSMIGMYSVNNSTFDLMILALFALIGAGLKLADYPLAPALLAFILGDKIEAALRQSLTIAQGDATVFFTRPISAFLLACAAIIFVVSILTLRRPMREED